MNAIPLSAFSKEYALLNLQLQEVFARDQGESDVADEIRDRMDGPWYKMTSFEQEMMRGLSTDLNLLLDKNFNTAPMSDEHMQVFYASLSEAKQALESGNPLPVLKLLRGKLPREGTEEKTGMLRAFQAIAWDQAGLPEAALFFIREAVRYDVHYEATLLMLLGEAKHHDEELRLARQLLSTRLDDSQAVIAAAVAILVSNTRQDNSAYLRDIASMEKPVKQCYETAKQMLLNSATDAEDHSIASETIQLLAEINGQIVGIMQFHGGNLIERRAELRLETQKLNRKKFDAISH